MTPAPSKIVTTLLASLRSARPGRNRRTAMIATVVTVAAAGVMIFVPSGAQAADTEVSLTENAASTVLYGNQASVELTASNPSGIWGYNASFVDVLPAGVSYVAGSSSPTGVGDPSVITDNSTNVTTLIWSNVSDLAPAATYSLSFKLAGMTENGSAPTLALEPGVKYTDHSAVYVNDNARDVTTFDPAGNPDPSTWDVTDTASGTTTISAIDIALADSMPESELPRGVHNHHDTYTVTVTNSKIDSTASVGVDVYLPASLEFLGCGTTDNTTNAAGTNSGSAREYPGAAALSAGAQDTSNTCVAPNSVTTEQLDPSGGDGSAPAQPISTSGTTATYTHLHWNLGTLAAGGVTTITYLAAVPLRENVAFTGNPATSGVQGSNLDNNTGPETSDGQSLDSLATVTGAYDGPLGAGTNPVTATTDKPVEAVDLAIQESVNPTTFSQGTVHTYTLHYETSEYRSASTVTVTAVVPNGECPLGATNYDPTEDAQCAPQEGKTPSLAYSSVTANADGSYTLTWNIAGPIAADTDTDITFPAVDRTQYQAAGSNTTPTLSGDALTSTSTITGTVSSVCDNSGTINKTCTSGTPVYSGESTPKTATNPSQAGLTTAPPTLIKRVATNPGTAANCATATYVTDPTEPAYVRGDTVCFQLEVDFPGGLDSRNTTITDLLPPGALYVAGSAQYQAANTVTQVTPDTSGATVAGGTIVWSLSDSTSGSNHYVLPSEKFLVDLEATITVDPPAATPSFITANLMKMTQTNTGGTAISLRSQASYVVDQPVMSVVNGVQQIDAGTVNGANSNVDGSYVKDGDSVTYRVDIDNSGEVAATHLTVDEELSSSITSCTSVHNLSNGATCSIFSGRVYIVWTNLAVTVAAGGTYSVSYEVDVPENAPAGADYASTAYLSGYDNVPDTGVTPIGYDSDASDPTDVQLPNATLSKALTSTSIVEAGNDNTTQMTPDETGIFTVTATIPAGTTAASAVVTDTLPAGLAFNGAVTYAITGTEATPTAGEDGNVFSANFSSALTASSSTPIVITLTVPVTALAADKRKAAETNTAGLTFTDSSVSNATATATIVEPNVTVTKTDTSSHKADPGEAVGYSIAVYDYNVGRSDVSEAHQVVAVDTLPIGMGEPTAVTGEGVVTGSAGSGWIITWTVGDLAPGDATSGNTYTYTATLPNPTSGASTFTNSVVATSSNLVTGGKTYTSTAATDTVTAPGATVSKIVSPTQPTIGQRVEYTVTASIPANLNLYNTTVVDTLPDGMVFDGYFGCNADTGVSCNALPVPIQAEDGTTRLAWSLGDIAASESPRTATLTYYAYPAQHKSGGSLIVAGNTFTNSVAVSWNQATGTVNTAIPSTSQDYDITSAPASATVTVGEPSVTVSDSGPGTLTPGTIGTWTVTGTNSTGENTATADDVVISAVVPAGLDVDPSGISDGGTYNPVTRTVSWPGATLGTTDEGDSVSHTFTATVDSPLTTDSSYDVAASASYDGFPGAATTDPTQARYRQYTSNTADTVTDPIFPSVSIVKTTSAGHTSGDQATVNSPFGWKIVVTNATTAGSTDPVITDTLPDGWNYDAGTATWNGDAITDPVVNGQQLTFMLSASLPTTGSSGTLAYLATPTASAVLGDTANVNGAIATFSDRGGYTADGSGPYVTNSSSASATVPAADLTVTLTPSGPVIPGAPSTWDVSIPNNGPGNAYGPTTITDTLPPGATDPSCSDGWTTTFTSTTLTCVKAGTLDNGATDSSLVITFTPPSSAHGTINDTVTVANGTFDPNLNNNSSTAGAAATLESDLSLTKTHTGALTPGAVGTYQLLVTNNGPSDSDGLLTVTDTLPASETFASVAHGSDWTCHGTSTVTCTVSADVAAGSTAPELDLNVHVKSNATSSITNIAHVAGPNDDPAPDNNSASNTSSVVPSADLAIGYTHEGAFTAGTDGRYLVVVTNLGPSDASGPLTVVDVLGAGETYSPSDTPSQAWTCSGTTTVTCVLPAGLAVLHVAPLLTIGVSLASNVTAPQVSQASVSSPTTDPVLHNNTASDTTRTPLLKADLAIVKHATADTFTAGENGSYTLDVTNNGPSDSAGPVTVTDTLPSGESFVSASGSNDSYTWTCSADGQQVTCTEPDALPAGDSLPTINLTVAFASSDTPGDISNTAQVSSPTNDPTEGNNSSTDVTPVITQAQLVITKTHQGQFTPGTEGTYVVTVANNGPSDAAGVSFTDPLPAGETFDASSVTSGGSADVTWSCSVDGSDTVTCSLSGPLPTGQDAVATFGVDVDPSYLGSSLVNTATVHSATDDTNQTVTSTSTVHHVTPEADVAVTGTVSTPAVAGDGITYTLQVANNGPSDAGTVTFTDTLPAGATFVSVSTPDGSLWDCTGSVGSATVTCTLADGLAVGADPGAITIVAGLSSSIADGTTLTDDAHVRSVTRDPKWHNNDVKLTSDVAANADLAIVTGHAGGIVPGGPTTYTLDVTNNGPSDAGPVTVTTTLPAGLTYNSATGTGWACSEDSGTLVVTCVLAAGLPDGQAAPTIDLVVDVTGAAYPSVSLTADVTSTTTDPVTPNNTSSVTDPVTAVSSLGLTKTHTGTIMAGSDVTYTLTVTNSGLTSDPGPITVTDTLPAGLTYVSGGNSDWTCTDAAQVVTCVLAGPLAVGASSSFPLVTLAGALAVPTVTNTAVVYSEANAGGGSSSTASDPTVVTPVATLSISKKLVGKLVGGADASWLISVTNHGPSATSGKVTITDTLPAGLQFVSASGGGWTCSDKGQVTTCATSDSLANGATSSVTVVTLVLANSGSITNTATVAEATDQAASAVDSAKASAAVAPAALASTGSDIEMVAVLGLSLLGAGLLMMLAGYRRRELATPRHRNS